MGYNDYDKNYNGNGSYMGYGNNSDVVSVGTWVLILIVTGIPIINIIALLVMAFGQGNANIKNFSKASLILVAIPLTLLILLRGCA